MVKLVNRAKMKVASGGASTLTLGQACDGYQSFADAGVTDQNKLRYAITDNNDWEIGVGTYTASGTTLARAPTESSNSGNAITCGSGAEIFVTMAAEDFTGNAVPIWATEPPTTLRLDYDGTTAVTLTGVAVDENSFPISYSWDGHSGSTVYSDTSLPPQLVSAPTINQATGEVSLIGSSDTADFGNFNFRMKASDGVKTQIAITNIELKSFPPTGITGFYDADPNFASVVGGNLVFTDQSGLGNPDATGTSYASSIGTIFGKPAFGTGGNAQRYVSFQGDYGSGTGGQIGTTIFISASTDTSIRGYANSSSFDFFVFVSFSHVPPFNVYSGPANPKFRINKVECATPTSAQGGADFVTNFSLSKMNSLAYTGFMPTALNGLIHPSFNHNRPSNFFVRAALFFNKTLTNAEIDSVHDYYSAIYGTDMAG